MVDLDKHLRLKSYVYFNVASDGVFFQGREGSFVLKGGGLYPLVGRLVGLMDAGHTCRAIYQQLPDKLHDVFDQLLAQLGRHDMLLDQQLFADIKAEYTDFGNIDQLLDYLQDRLGDFRPLFEKWRDTRVHLVGGGYALKAVADALSGSGLRTLNVCFLPTKEGVTREKETRDVLARATQQIPDFDAHIAEVGDSVANFTRDADFIVFAADQIDDDLLPPDIAQPYIVAGVLEGVALVSPLSRYSASGFADVRERLRPSPNDAQLFPPVACSMLGGLAAFHLLRYFFDIDTAFLRNYVVRVSPYLDISRHPLLPASLATENLEEAVAFEQEFEVPDDRDVHLYEKALIHVAPLLDPVFGSFSQDKTKALKQVPLFHEVLDIRFPRGLARPDETIISWGFDVADAGLRVLKQGLCVLAEADHPNLDQHIVTEFDEEAWRAAALSTAIASWPWFGENARGIVVGLGAIKDKDVHVLQQILALYLCSDVTLELHWLDGYPAYAARVVPNTQSADTSGLGCAVASNPLAAIKEALGIAYCRHHFEAMAVAGDVSGWLNPSTAVEHDSDGRIVSALLDANARSDFGEPVRLALPLAPHAIFTGYLDRQRGPIVANG